MLSFRELDRAIDASSHQRLAALCKRLIRTNTEASDLTHELLVLSCRTFTQVAAAAATVARKRKHEDFVEVIRFETLHRM